MFFTALLLMGAQQGGNAEAAASTRQQRTKQLRPSVDWTLFVDFLSPACQSVLAVVEELQIEVERLQYDKDTTMFNLSKQQGAEHEELEELRRLLMAEMGKPSWYQKYTEFMANPYRTWKENRSVTR